VAAAVPGRMTRNPSPEVAEEPIHRRPARYAWALLVARIYEVLPLICARFGAGKRTDWRAISAKSQRL